MLLIHLLPLQLQADEQLPKATQLRQVKYLNNRVELSPQIYQTTDAHQEWDLDRSTQPEAPLEGLSGAGDAPPPGDEHDS